jgi:3-hydroxybutyryl-CoA dehydrogenase
VLRHPWLYCMRGMDRQRVAIVGTGVMATGIARLCLGHGYGVVILSSSGRADEVAAMLKQEAEDPAASVSTDRAGLTGCSLLIEATVEELPAKRAALQGAEPSLPPDAVLASTTSSLSITEVASGLKRPERFLGLHFFNPVHRMRLVEVVAGMRTGDAAVEAAMRFARGLGKEPLKVPDRAGFLVNRLLIPYLNNAARLVEGGMATVGDVDQAMQLGAGHPLGPFGLIDLIGADVVLAIARSLTAEFHRDSDAPSPELRRRVSLGLLGRKTGRGYYQYPPKGSSTGA